MKYPSIGYFENETFRPRGWVPTYPNPAFERCTNRDGYWGSKIVMSFRDEDIRAMVQMGQYSDPGATDELTRLLAERRDMIGRYWYERVNPLDHFTVDGDRLRFVDLAVAGGLVAAESRQWQYATLDGDGDETASPRMVDEQFIQIGEEAMAGQYFGFRLQSRDGMGTTWSNNTTVFLYKHENGRLQLVSVERDG